MDRPAVPKRYMELVHLIARGFYSGQCPPPGVEDPQHPPASTSRKKELNVGVGIVVLDALTKREWVAEEDFAADLKIPMKVLRRVLRYLEQELIIAREHRKAVAEAKVAEPTQESFIPPSAQVAEEDEDAPQRAAVVSYCKLDYPTLLEATQLRLHRLRANLRKGTEDRSEVLIFKCPTSWCGKEASTLDAVALVQHDGYHCDVCDALLEPLSTTQGSGGLTQEQRQALLDLQAKAEAQLDPLSKHMGALLQDVRQGRAVPDTRSLAEWLVEQQEKANAAAAPSEGLALPSDFQQDATTGAAAAAAGEVAPKELPPWLRQVAEEQAAGLSAGGRADLQPNGKRAREEGTTAPVKATGGGWLAVEDEPATKRSKSGSMPTPTSAGASKEPEADEADDVEWE